MFHFHNIPKMFSLDDFTNNNNEHHKWQYSPDHSYRMLTIENLDREKLTICLIDKRTSYFPIDKIYLFARNLNEPKYHLLIKKREEAGIYINELKAFIEYSNTMDDAYNSISNYDPKRKRKILIVFDDMIAYINTNKTFHAIVKKLFLRCRKLNIELSLLFLSHNISFLFQKEVRLNSTLLIMKIYNKRELQNIAIKHSIDIDYQNCMKIFQKSTNKLFFNIDITLPAHNHLRFRKNLLDSL